MEAAIQARKAVCKELREARRGAQDEIVQRKREKYRNKRKLVKKLIREEKNEMRKRTMNIRDQGGPNCKLFWADLKGGQQKKRSIPRMKTRCAKVVDEPAEVVELAKHWEELGKCTCWENDQQVGQRELEHCHR